MNTQTKKQRIGIYSGTFDPVHAGHIGFALQAAEAANLDVLYFLPERRPRYKQGVEHYGHRVAMIKRAIKPYRKLRVLELEDTSFSVTYTLPRLQKRFSCAQLVFLLGSDVVGHIADWPNVSQLFRSVELVVGLRSKDGQSSVAEMINDWALRPRAVTFVQSYAAGVSSKHVREGLRSHTYAPGLLQSVRRYSRQNWLYVSLVHAKNHTGQA